VFRGRLTAGLLLLEALVAVQSPVVATIMPDVRRDLGMVQLYGLVLTATGLATIASIPIVGKAIDRFGTKRPPSCPRDERPSVRPSCLARLPTPGAR
jgi:MFS family permease